MTALKNYDFSQNDKMSDCYFGAEKHQYFHSLRFFS